MALIKRDYVCSHLRHYVERYILSCDVCQAAEIKTSRHRKSTKTLAGAQHQMAQCVHRLGFGIAADHKGP